MRRLTLIALAAASAATACVVGEEYIPGDDQGGGGGGGGGGGSGSGSGSNQVNPRLTCDNRGAPDALHDHTAVAGAPAGARSGLGCMNANGCHGPTPGAGGSFAFAGTVYKQLAGTTPNAGVVVRLFKENPVGTFALVTKGLTDAAGNFGIGGAYTDFPYLVEVTACGADAPVMGIRPMVTVIRAQDANCNLGGCHAVPGPMAAYLAD